MTIEDEHAVLRDCKDKQEYNKLLLAKPFT